MVSNLILVMSNLENWGTALAQAHRIWFKFHSIPALLEVRKLTAFTTLELFELHYKQPTILFQNDNSKFFNWILRKIEKIVARDYC